MIPIDQLHIGDYVKVGMDDTNIFSQVYSLGHYNPNVFNEFIQLYWVTPFTILNDMNYTMNMPLEVSANHLLFVQRKWDNNMVPIPASDVQVGDVLSSGIVVASIQTVMRQGVYSPMTYSGELIVNGIQVSNHVKLMTSTMIGWDQHTIGQIVTFPRRMVCHINMKYCKNESYTSDGYAVWVAWIIRMASLINQGGSVAAIFTTLFSAPLALGIIYPFVGLVTTLVGIQKMVQTMRQSKN
jgi:Hint module